MFKRSLALIAVAAVTGCSGMGTELARMRFACSSPTDCVEGFTCHAGTCVLVGTFDGDGEPNPRQPSGGKNPGENGGENGNGEDAGGTKDPGNKPDGSTPVVPDAGGNPVPDGGNPRLLSNGAFCSFDGQCTSSFCRDGVCCNTSCDGSCNTCNQSKWLGSCTNLKPGNPGVPMCSGFLVCNGGSTCPTQCTSEDDCGSGHGCLNGACVAVTTFSVSVSSGEDDAEESLVNGQVRNASTDLELTTAIDSGIGKQVIGMRFRHLAIPPRATIVSATIQFETDEVESSPPSTSVTFYAHATGSAPSFPEDEKNITSRPKTTASVSWNIPRWETDEERGPDQRTPNLAPILQEIVDRPDWVSGNHLAIIVTGTGRRYTVAYDKPYGQQAQLSVTYTQ